MIVLIALFIASWIAIVVLGSPNQAQAWNSPEIQPIAITVTQKRRSVRQ